MNSWIRREVFPDIGGSGRSETRLDHNAGSRERADRDLPPEQPDPVAHSCQSHAPLCFALQSSAVVGDANDEPRQGQIA